MLCEMKIVSFESSSDSLRCKFDYRLLNVESVMIDIEYCRVVFISSGTTY